MCGGIVAGRFFTLSCGFITFFWLVSFGGWYNGDYLINFEEKGILFSQKGQKIENKSSNNSAVCDFWSDFALGSESATGAKTVATPPLEIDASLAGSKAERRRDESTAERTRPTHGTAEIAGLLGNRMVDRTDSRSRRRPPGSEKQTGGRNLHGGGSRRGGGSHRMVEPKASPKAKAKALSRKGRQLRWHRILQLCRLRRHPRLLYCRRPQELGRANRHPKETKSCWQHWLPIWSIRKRHR